MKEYSKLQEIKQSKKKYAEFITNDNLRRFLAEKVKEYCGDIPLNVIDICAGSGQLCQYLNIKNLKAVEIQKDSCQTLKENFPNAEIYNQSFFTYQDTNDNDVVVCNYPFSLKFKELTQDDKDNIKKLFQYKKSGICDDIFILKSLLNAKRYAFIICAAGISFRNDSKILRQKIGNNLAELINCTDCFSDTKINVLLMIIDLQKTNNTYKTSLYDGSKNCILSQDIKEVNTEMYYCLNKI
ncbi:SAM-dependent methyltransferase [Helicobacter aurati]|uniref:SAM-dependent methyltransferase n=1 Tax=Helicobacter aurati TaxID=137778 RepID=A0A3D8IZI8_9HELI|nr:N-6 DNA methylase [Helicobacter aurati]RDU70380.1 SAM-dependent methyltransferase [Helicobacter aurati]